MVTGQIILEIDTLSAGAFAEVGFKFMIMIMIKFVSDHHFLTIEFKLC